MYVKCPKQRTNLELSKSLIDKIGARFCHTEAEEQCPWTIHKKSEEVEVALHSKISIDKEDREEGGR